ncbi:MAG TPA: hypothetical protein VJM06_00125 [Gaiellaceae bacterium]|nr:hypothetical protein [Gaiellaceae bacterium]
MRRWVFTALLLGLSTLTFPFAASAGWGNSPYEKGDCTYTKETHSLYCETIVIHETVKTEVLSIADESCLSGLRQVSRTGTFVEPTFVFDGFDGPAPNANRNTFGDDVPLFGEEFWTDFTDTALGCFVAP